MSDTYLENTIAEGVFHRKRALAAKALQEASSEGRRTARFKLRLAAEKAIGPIRSPHQGGPVFPSRPGIQTAYRQHGAKGWTVLIDGAWQGDVPSLLSLRVYVHCREQGLDHYQSLEATTI